MKKIFTLLFAVVVSMMTMAQTSVLIVNDTAEYAISGSTKQTFDISAPCARLMLNAKHTASSLTTTASLLGNLTIEQCVDGTWETLYQGNPGIVTTAERTTTILGQTIKLGEYEASVDYESLSFDLNRHASQIRFSGSLLNDKQIKNVQVSMASYVEVSPKSLNFGEMVVWSDPVTLPFYVEHCNVARLSMSSNNADFALSATTVQNSGIGQYATDTFNVTFTPNIMGSHTATITVSNGTYTDSIHLAAKVTKRTPVFTFDHTVLTVGDTIDAPLSSDCSNQFMLASCESQVAEISCGKLIARSAGEATITAMQLGDDSYWNNKVETYNVIVNAASEPTAVASLENSKMLEFDGKTLSAEADGMTSLEVYDLQGNLLESHDANGLSRISTRIFLPTGNYIAIAHAGKNVESLKFVVE